MHKHAVTRYGVVVILATICCHVYAANLDVAREALRSYFNAAVSGDTLMINNTTTKEARGVETIGLRAYYYAVYRQSTGEELSAEYKILEESEGPGYVKFLVSDPLLANHSRWFFLTFQDSSWRITAPYKILCADYCHIETDHFVIYWSNKKSSISPHLDIRPSLLSLTKMEELYDRVSELLRYEVPYKIEYYICPSVGDPDLFLHGLEGGKHQGHNSIDSRVCFAIHPYNAHVLTHAISISAIQKKTPPHPISILREGLATAFQWPDARIGHIPSVILVKNMLQEKSCPTLDSVICCYGSIPLEKNYPISATFVLFLLEMYGEDRFRSLWYNHPHDNPHAFIDYVETMYGRSITELEDEWKGWVNEEVEKLNVGIEYEYNQILTTNWQSTESEYFVVHHKADEKPSAKILGQTDSLYVNINDRIGLNPLTRIDY
ncbi:hypothetical protein IBX73_10105, partial [candidate division WOR-3 bacterium]|nr:hypothetical protein [candidate division WOR-3 bacterium]